MLSKEKTGLIVVDIQGKLARVVHQSDTLISNCTKLIRGAKIAELPIILLEQNPEKLGLTVDELSRYLKNTPPISKITFNACDTSEFVRAVQETEVDTWLVCGIEAHICVYQTARGLVDLGFNVEIVGDCVSSRCYSNVQLALNRARALGIEITGLEMCLYELIRDCRTPEFKQLLELVR